MIIKKITINNFGKLHQKQMEFSPGINVIYGENEAGKSTLQQFLKSMMFGLEKKRGRASSSDPYQKYEPWDAPAYFSGKMIFETGARQFLLERNFYSKETASRLVNLEDGEELSVEQGDLRMLLGGISSAAYENTYCISQQQFRPGKELEQLLADAKSQETGSGDGSFQLSIALDALEDRRRTYEQQRGQLERKRTEEVLRMTAEEETRSQVIKELREQIERQKQRGDVWKQQESSKQKEEKEAVLPAESAEQKVRFFQPLLVFGILGFFLKDLIRGQFEIPKSVDHLLAALFVVMIAVGLGMLIHNRRKRMLSSDPEAAREHASSDPAALQEAVSLERAAEGLKDAMREQELSLENIRQQKAEKEMAGFEERKLKKQSEAAVLARDTILRLSREMQSDQEDRIREHMSEILARMTSGKYDDLILNDKRQVQVRQDRKERKPEAYSEATMQQMYFAYRMASGACLNKEENLPFLLDEAFAAYDEIRLQKTLGWLSEQPHQIFIFTCRRLEAELLREQGIPFLEVSL